MQITSCLISFIKSISCPILATESVGLVWYPLERWIDAVASGKVNVKGIVTNIYDLDDVQRAMDESVHNKADIVKGVIKIHP